MAKKLTDQPQRDAIADDLESTILVEAAAGTGKTTSMIDRMVNLLASGALEIDTLAAVTFTRKAAAEIRGRFQVGLEKEIRQSKGESQSRLKKAIAHIDRCFIGTIHSFCGRILRERPVEARVDIHFTELDQVTDDLLRREVWREYIDGLVTAEDTDAARITVSLAEVGLDITQLRGAFLNFCDFPDVDDWPVPKIKKPALTAVRRELAAYADHMRSLLPFESAGSDKLIPKYEQIARMARVLDLGRAHNVARILELFFVYKGRYVTQKCWPEGKEQAQREQAKWEHFTTTFAEPFLQQWREYRYGFVLEAIRPAVRLYQQRLEEEGGLNFQDLLMRAGDLLRHGPAVRRYFQNRFTHLLVDEFQDTDPLQAEVMLLLTADDVHENDWRACRPRPGSLFVVGDPKQSIYRFRRADIVTYRRVKQIIADCDGDILTLSTNFRSQANLIDWVNTLFAGVFAEEESDKVPQFVSMDAGRGGVEQGELVGLHRLDVPKISNNREQTAYEAGQIARIIRQAIDQKWQLPDREGKLRPAEPGDFMIITRHKQFLSDYGAQLQVEGIPHQVTGGNAMGNLGELQLLVLVLRALARPEDPIALLAVLRSPLFGIADTLLYEWKEAGGRFEIRRSEADDPPIAEVIAPLEQLVSCIHLLRQLPLIAAVEQIANRLGLTSCAASARDGATRAGGLLGAIEQLRTLRDQAWNLETIAETLEGWQGGNEEQDPVPVVPSGAQPVRVLNLHKAKGLEANFIFLAGVKKVRDTSAELHIDRSGDHTHGFVAIAEEKRSGNWAKTALLAHPGQWQDHSDEEIGFLEAEQDRLAYVAATRARGGLSITCCEGGKDSWEYFDAEEEPFASLPTIEAASEAPSATEAIDPADALAAAERAAAEWQQAAVATYRVVAAKADAIGNAEDRDHVQATGEHGTEWGTAVHRLLEVAMQMPEADLHPLALALIEETGLEVEAVEPLLETVERARHSAIWKRALKSPQPLVEAPFVRLASEADGDESKIVRGVIDLAFLEGDSWVLVDYKSDRVGKDADKAEATLRSRYQAQLDAYAEAWEQVTGQKVSERGLLLTHYDRYVTV